MSVCPVQTTPRILKQEPTPWGLQDSVLNAMALYLYKYFMLKAAGYELAVM